MNGVEIVTSELGPLSPDLYFRLIPTPFKAVPIHRFLLVQDSLPALFWGLEPSERSFRASRPAKTELRLFDLGFNHCLILVVRKDFAGSNNGQMGCFRVNSYTPAGGRAR